MLRRPPRLPFAVYVELDCWNWNLATSVPPVGGGGFGARSMQPNCFYRTHVQPADCARDPSFDTYTAPSYGDWRNRLPHFRRKGKAR